jgi:hypothetical protein
MNTNFLKNGIRLAALAAFTLLPGMACTYSATSPVVGSAGGKVAVTVYTQPGCAWTAEGASFGSVIAGRQGRGSGTFYMYVSPNSGRAARSAVVRGYNTVQSYGIPGRSGPTVQIVFQSTLTQYGR